MIGYWRTVQRIMTWLRNGELVVPPELKPPVSRAKLEWQFMLLFGRKNLGDNPDFVAIFRNSKLVDATI